MSGNWTNYRVGKLTDCMSLSNIIRRSATCTDYGHMHSIQGVPHLGNTQQETSGGEEGDTGGAKGRKVL